MLFIFKVRVPIDNTNSIEVGVKVNKFDLNSIDVNLK